MMTPEECRAARELMNWSQEDLARASRVPSEIVAMFEDGKLAGMTDSQAAMREALEPVWHWLGVIDRGRVAVAGVPLK